MVDDVRVNEMKAEIIFNEEDIFFKEMNLLKNTQKYTTTFITPTGQLTEVSVPAVQVTPWTERFIDFSGQLNVLKMEYLLNLKFLMLQLLIMLPGVVVKEKWIQNIYQHVDILMTLN